VTGTDDLPEWALVCALASLRESTRLRLGLLLAEGPREAWARQVREHGADRDLPARCHETCVRHGISVLVRGTSGFPRLLERDPAPPSVLFVRGDIGVLGGRRAAVVGTRNATRAGRHFARTLGRRLAESGVNVVSGLARGIDGEAHAGALEASVAAVGMHPGTSGRGRPVGIVASGLEVVYPREHRDLWESVAATGVLISEAPPGAPPEPYRFPQRNRIIAALSEVLVVVESAARGGSMLTVREAMQRGIDVMAVPGAPGVRTAEGTNALLRDGCAPVTHVDDVVVALGLTTVGPAGDRRRQPVGRAALVLGAMGHEPVTVEQLARRTALPALDVAVALGQLRELGWAESTAEWWEALVSHA